MNLAWCSLQNKIRNLPDQSTIWPKLTCDKEGKFSGPTQILLLTVRGPALILKTDDVPEFVQNYTNTSDIGMFLGLILPQFWLMVACLLGI